MLPGLQDEDTLIGQNQKSREEPPQSTLEISLVDHFISLSVFQNVRRMEFWSLKPPTGNNLLWKPQDDNLGHRLFHVVTRE